MDFPLPVGPGNQHKASLSTGDLYYFFGDSQRFRLRNLKWQAPHDCGAGSSLQENIDTKTPYPWDGVGEISLSLFLKFRSVVIIHERQKKLLQHIRCKVFSHYWSQNSIHAVAWRSSHCKVDI